MEMEGWPVRIELTKSERTLVDPAIFAAPGVGYTRVSDPSGFTLVTPAAGSRR